MTDRATAPGRASGAPLERRFKLELVNVILMMIYTANIETDECVRLEREICDLANEVIPRILALSSPSVVESPTWKEKYERAVCVVVPFGCERQPHTSRTCERGTHCCGIRHGKTSAPSAAAQKETP